MEVAVPIPLQNARLGLTEETIECYLLALDMCVEDTVWLSAVIIFEKEVQTF